MTQATTPIQTILDKLNTLTNQQQQEVINFIEFLQFKAQKPQKNDEETPISFYEAAKEYIGCVDGGPGDLGTNKEYLKTMGK